MSEGQSNSEQAPTRTERAIVAAGCFWGVEAAYRQTEGVLSTSVGYIGGTSEEPTYKQVCSGRTGHAEAVEVVYDPDRVSYEEILDVFWANHDPTTLNRQGPDVGSQYRSAIFVLDDDQDKAARTSMDAEEASGRHRRTVVTEIAPVATYYLAEDYHQQYLEKRGMATCRI